jgi:hypothetical protein
LLEKPKPEIIPKSTITYRPTINKAGKSTTKPTTKPYNKSPTIVSDDEGNDTITNK